MTASLESALRSVAPEIEWPSHPDLTGRVMASIAASEKHLPARRERRSWAFATAGLALVAFAFVMAVSPSAREAVAGWLGVEGIRIDTDPQPGTSPSGLELRLGDPVSLQQAAEVTDFEISVPALVGAPDAVFIDTSVPDGLVQFVYEAGPGYPEIDEGVGLLAAQFRGRPSPDFFKKVSVQGTRIRVVEVDFVPAYWLSGEDHILYYVGPDGVREDRARYAAHTLVWEIDGITYRLESRLGLDAMMAIAESMEPIEV